MRVLIVVTHLLGAGHLSRALTLARGFVASGADVTIASGGMPVAQFDSSGISLRQLPPVRSDGTNFTRLLDADGAVVDAPYLAGRAQALDEILTTQKPDLLITELFPFGRRILKAEFESLLRTAQKMVPRPIILASIRDILAPPSKPEKAQRTDALIASFYDGVLVHSDPASTPLDQCWPVSAALREKLFYTGYVAPPAAGPHPDKSGADEVLVSAGGGSVGDQLFETCIQAARLENRRAWRILVGGSDAATRIARLQHLVAKAPVILEAARPDFRQMLYHAAASVSMCGYNTALDLMQAGCPTVFVPFDEGGEVEQTLRAQSLCKLPQFSMISAAEITPERLLTQVSKVQTTGHAPADLGFDGVNESIQIATKLLEARP